MINIRFLLLPLYILVAQYALAGELEYDSFAHFRANEKNLDSQLVLFQETDLNEDGYQDVLATFNDGLHMSLIILHGNDRGKLSLCCTANAETGLRVQVRTIKKYAKNAFFLTFYIRPDELNAREAQYSFRFAIIGDQWRLIGESYVSYLGEPQPSVDKHTMSVNFVTGKRVNKTIRYNGEVLTSEQYDQHQVVLMKDFFFNKPESMTSEEKSYSKGFWWLEKDRALYGY